MSHRMKMLNGQVYWCVDEELGDWASRCAECGGIFTIQLFENRTHPFLNRRCEPCAKPGKSVKGSYLESEDGGKTWVKVA